MIPTTTGAMMMAGICSRDATPAWGPCAEAAVVDLGWVEDVILEGWDPWGAESPCLRFRHSDALVRVVDPWGP